MQQIQIPENTPDWSARVVLDGQPYFLTLTLNERTNRWHFHLADANNTFLLQGRKILTGLNLLRGIGAPGAPPGILTVVDYSAPPGSGVQPRQPTFENLGTELQLIYITFDEVQALGG